jgi:hypothetical protein
MMLQQALMETTPNSIQLLWTSFNMDFLRCTKSQT